MYITAFRTNPRSIGSVADGDVRPVETALPTDPDLADRLAGAGIVFMDVDLGAGSPAGTDVVRSLVSADAQIVYVSGYLELVLQTFRTRHVGFVSKPFDPAELKETLARACNALRKQRQSSFVLKTGGALVKLNPRRVVYIESDRRCVVVHERTRTLRAYAQIGELERALPEQFVRCHKSFIVNMAQVVELLPGGARLAGGATVPVSQRLSSRVRERFQSYVAGTL